MRGTLRAILALLVASADPLPAQRLAPSLFPIAPAAAPAARMSNAVAVPPAPPADPVLLALGGIAGGAVGGFTGALVGARLTEHRCEDCGFVGAAYGLVAGGSALLPLGVHVANRGRGNFGRSLLASLAIGGTGFMATLATNQAEIMLAVPVLQSAAAVGIERATSR